MADELLNKRESTLENLTLSFTISEQSMFTGSDVLRNSHCHGADMPLTTNYVLVLLEYRPWLLEH